MKKFWWISFFLCFSLLSGAEESPIKEKKLLILGDSLTEGYGVAKESAYPNILENQLRQAGKNVRVVNAGIGGSTSASALGRLRWSLKAKPEVLILALGSNDGLRGIKLAETEKNLAQAVELAKKKNIVVVLAGMKLPPNYGDRYVKGFEKMYRDLAARYKLPLIPFLLKGVGGRPELNLADGIHPNEKGHEKIALTVKEFIISYL